MSHGRAGTWALLGSAAWCLAACAPQGGPLGCRPESCGEHGLCDDASGRPLCTCQLGYQGARCELCAPGYHLEGGGCAPDRICLENSCSGHGACDDASGLVRCTCLAGYDGDACERCAEGYEPDGQGGCALACQPACAAELCLTCRAGECVSTCAPGDPCLAGACLDGLTIYDLQDATRPAHPAEGSPVALRGVYVTALEGQEPGDTFWVQEAQGGPFSGILVYNQAAPLALAVGDAVDVSGLYQEYLGLSEVVASSVSPAGGFLSLAPAVVDPARVATGGPDAEPFEGVLVRVEQVTVLEANPDAPDDFGEFGVSGGLRVDDELWALQPDPIAGDAFASLTGVMHFSYGQAKLLPRGASDAVVARGCGDGAVEAGEECDGPADSACPGRCSAHCACPALAPADVLQVHMLDVGQGDSILVISPDGFALLIDAGNDDAIGALTARLQALGVPGLDYTLVTHMHNDHVGGMDRVLTEIDGITACFDHGGSYTSNDYDWYVSQAGARRRTLVSGARLDLGPRVVAEVLHAGGGDENENNLSVVLRIAFGDTRVLLGGDCEWECEATFDPGPIDVYKVHHHGSSSSSSVELLQQMSPDLALISVGAGNDYGHPHESTLERLADFQVEVRRSDLEGHVEVRCDGLACWVP